MFSQSPRARVGRSCYLWLKWDGWVQIMLSLKKEGIPDQRHWILGGFMYNSVLGKQCQNRKWPPSTERIQNVHWMQYSPKRNESKHGDCSWDWIHLPVFCLFVCFMSPWIDSFSICFQEAIAEIWESCWVILFFNLTSYWAHSLILIHLCSCLLHSSSVTSINNGTLYSILIPKSLIHLLFYGSDENIWCNIK